MSHLVRGPSGSEFPLPGSSADDLHAPGLPRTAPRLFRRELVDAGTFRSLCDVRDWLAANAFHKPTLADAAARAGFSPFHFQRLFSRAFGESPHEFLTRIRIERAQRVLRTSVDPVTEICFDLGYESLGSFSALFTREVGIAPSAYRRVFSCPELWALKATPACFRRVI